MLLELKIRLTKPFLGHQFTRDQIRRFIREGDDDLALLIPQWIWALSQAAQSLHLDKLDLETVRFPLSMKAPRLDFYTLKDVKNGKPREERFEAIHPGTILTLDLVVTSSSEKAIYSHTKGVHHAPTIEELKTLLEFAGKRIGLSPYGSLRGFGRFSVESLIER